MRELHHKRCFLCDVFPLAESLSYIAFRLIDTLSGPAPGPHRRALALCHPNWGAFRACLSRFAWNASTAGSEGLGRGNALELPDYWAVDMLHAWGARAHLAHTLGSRKPAIGGRKTTYATPVIWLICCGSADCPRRGSLRPQTPNCGSLSAVAPSWCRSDLG
jgi:hypothetical protein